MDDDKKPTPRDHYAVLNNLWNSKHVELDAAARKHHAAKQLSKRAAGREEAIQHTEFDKNRIEAEVNALAWALDVLKRVPQS